MLPTTIPVFPLPSVVLFPNVFLPLHIFEARYRQMVADAIAGDRMIGMVLLKPGHEADDEGRPPIYRTGCSGLITHVERLDDGRYNLVLRGIDKFTVHGEDEPGGAQPYRRAVITTIAETVAGADRDHLKLERRRLEAMLTPFLEGGLVEHRLPATMPDEDLINALAQYMEFEPLERLALLEREGPLARCRSMIELLEMKALLKKTSGDLGMIH